VFYQLAYDLQLPPEQSLVKQACIWSNSPGVQPKNAASAQVQFNQLLSALKIPTSLPWPEKLSRLRSIPTKSLLDAATSIELHQFRPTSDGSFIDPSLFKSLDNGTFARKLAARNIRIMLGECRDERSLYATWHPPRHNTLASLHSRLLADYPAHIADALIKLYCPQDQLPPGCANWQTDAFGLIYADMQVHKTQRGLVHALAADASHLLYRYRIEKRLQCADRAIPPSWGVTHATDQYLWFWGNGEALLPEEKPMVREAFIDPLTRFVRNDAHADVGWGTGDYRLVRTLRPDGSVQICEDGLWDEAMRVWRALREVGEPEPQPGEDATAAKL
jgi:carboxylesterase type B